GATVTAEDRASVIALLECSGQAREMPENLFDAVTALSGSGPAFVAVLAQAFVEGAAALGMAREDALALTLQTLRGTAKVLAEGNVPLTDFVAHVTSKGGTTAAGRAVLEASDVAAVIAATLGAAAQRSRELGN
ncbi:MAG: pyrroline-5-carboxylate reductase, partial [Kiritimatiellaeota bacterium]|nr:pyrroline-5-carboxylate reductase [Kiritimatiellota bacterium]